MGKDTYTLDETVTITITRSTEINDLAGVATISELGTITTVSPITKTGNDTLGTYTLGGQLASTFNATTTAVYDGLSSTRTESPAFTTILDEDGDFSTDDYTATITSSFAAFTFNETGDVNGDTLTATGSTSGNVTIVETGKFTTGDYTIQADSVTQSLVSQTITNASTTSTLNLGGSTGDLVTATLFKLANWDTGSYSLTETVHGAGGKGDLTSFAFPVFGLGCVACSGVCAVWVGV